MTGRRKFLAKAGGAIAVAAAAAVVDAPNVIAQPKFKWRMPTTWPPALDVWQGSALRLAKVVEEMSGGRLQIEVSSAGQIMPRSASLTRSRSRGSGRSSRGRSRCSPSRPRC